MSYCSIADITAVIPHKELVQLTNDLEGDTVDSTKVTDAISYVDNVIDGYLRGRYSLPLTSTSDTLKYLAIDFVVYRLYSRRMLTDLPIAVEQKYKEIIRILSDIQRGNFNLGVESTDGYSDGKIVTDKGISTSTENKFYNKETWDTYGDGY